MAYTRSATFPGLLSAVLLVMLRAVTATAATTETVLYNFAGSGSGSNPYGNLVADTTGNLYGTTGGGGASTNCNLGSGCGTVFELTQQSGVWTQTVLYSFQGASVGDGSGPQSGLVMKSGAIYGTTASGGANGYGTVFELAPPAKQGGAWTETVLYSFKGGADGSYPSSGVIFDGTSLVGTTPFGGSSAFGVVFELTPPKKKGSPWTEAILYNFTGRSDGGKPYCALTLKTNSLYGTTLDGGPSGQGAVFELTPPAKAGGAWTYTVLYGFTGGADGGKPYAGVIFIKTALYGTTGLGGGSGYGTVFELTPGKTGSPWAESVLYSFTGGADGSYARYGVVADTKGNLYGTTGVGSTNSGVVFQLVPAKTVPWPETVLWSFTGGSDGGNPTAGLLLNGTMLYGTTSTGGEYSEGTVFSVTP
ncbi:MAG: choice-of-anchor tandem repeat GloVer-containing protein [Terriglobales bacterium]|jgi:uncharacterized repeat protein (TIGR03803 family)